jgi:cell division protein FtsW (lipid II flippase)
MKKSIEIVVHIFLWSVFTLLVIMLCKIYLQIKPDASFSQHFVWVIILELIMGLIFFYTTFFAIPWATRKKVNFAILAAILLFLLLFFAYPATKVGIWQVMSSIVPHIMLIFLAFVFRGFSYTINSENRKQALIL